uniref:Uncharacterized protein n=1 Tax=Acrobeloides nanus TaxID=290746 RepID=A0A914D086_9BILA
MIQLVESETDPIDAVSLQHLTDQVRALDIDDLETFLKIIPPTSELIKSIPQSLQLLDAIYEKCDKVQVIFFDCSYISKIRQKSEFVFVAR